MQGWDGGDAEVDLLAAHGQLDAAILRQSALSDIEPRHDLDARGDRGRQTHGGRLGFVQNAVIAVANAQPVLERLDVDIGGAGFHGAGDDLVDQTDHGRLAGHVLQTFGVVFRGAALGTLLGRVGAATLGVQAGEGCLQLDGHRHLKPHR